MRRRLRDGWVRNERWKRRRIWERDKRERERKRERRERQRLSLHILIHLLFLAE